MSAGARFGLLALLVSVDAGSGCRTPRHGSLGSHEPSGSEGGAGAQVAQAAQAAQAGSEPNRQALRRVVLPRGPQAPDAALDAALIDATTLSASEPGVGGLARESLKVEEGESDPRSETVTIKVVVDPPKPAHVFWGAQDLGVAPLEIKRPRGSGPVDLVVRSPGALTVHTRAFTDRDDKIAIRLVPETEAARVFGYRPPQSQSRPDQDPDQDPQDQDRWGGKRRALTRASLDFPRKLDLSASQVRDLSRTVHATKKLAVAKS